MIIIKAIFSKKILLLTGLSFWFSLSFAQNSRDAVASSVIVLRAEDDLPGSKPAWVYVDGMKECSLTAGQHMILSPSIGEHTFFVSFSAKRKLKARENETAFSIKCEAGKTMYLHIVSNPANRKNVSCTPIVESSAKKLLQDSKMRDCPSKK
jgi:hypothetical protein